MDAQFANQIGQKTIRTPNAVSFCGPARQYGSGGLGAFAPKTIRDACGRRIWKELFIVICAGNLKRHLG